MSTRASRRKGAKLGGAASAAPTTSAAAAPAAPAPPTQEDLERCQRDADLHVAAIDEIFTAEAILKCRGVPVKETPPGCLPSDADIESMKRLITGRPRSRSPVRLPVSSPDRESRSRSPPTIEVRGRMGHFTADKLKAHTAADKANNEHFWTQSLAELLSQLDHRMYYAADNEDDQITLRMSWCKKYPEKKHLMWDVVDAVSPLNVLATARTRRGLRTDDNLAMLKRCICRSFEFHPSNVTVRRTEGTSDNVEGFEISTTWRAMPISDAVCAARAGLDKAAGALRNAADELAKLAAAIAAAPDL